MRLECREVGDGRTLAGEQLERGARERVDVEGADRAEAGATEAERAAAGTGKEVEGGRGHGIAPGSTQPHAEHVPPGGHASSWPQAGHSDASVTGAVVSSTGRSS